MDTTVQPVGQWGFILLTAVYYGLLFRQLKTVLTRTGWSASRQRRIMYRSVLVIIVWAAFVSIWSLSGVMADFTLFPGNVAPVIIIPLIGILILTFSPGGTRLLAGVSQHHLIQLQSFRVFVEVLLWALYLKALLPVQMTFEGRNFDVVAGLTAPIVASLAARGRLNKTSLLVWNVVSLGLLINIVVIAVLSMPTPLSVFEAEPANTLVTQFPASFLPAFLVPLAYGLHFLSLRKLIASSLAESSALP